MSPVYPSVRRGVIRDQSERLVRVYLVVVQIWVWVLLFLRHCNFVAMYVYVCLYIYIHIYIYTSLYLFSQSFIISSGFHCSVSYKSVVPWCVTNLTADAWSLVQCHNLSVSTAIRKQWECGCASGYVSHARGNSTTRQFDTHWATHLDCLHALLPEIQSRLNGFSAVKNRSGSFCRRLRTVWSLYATNFLWFAARPWGGGQWQLTALATGSITSPGFELMTCEMWNVTANSYISISQYVQV